MSRKNSTPKKSVKKNVVKKNVKKKEVKENVSKKVVKKVKAKDMAVPTPKVFSEMVAAMALLMNKVEEVINILENTIFPKSNSVAEQVNTNEQTNLFPTDKAPIQGSEYSEEDVCQALQTVSTVHGMDKVKVVLSKFKAQRISDIYATPNVFQKFIEHCNKVAAKKA